MEDHLYCNDLTLSLECKGKNTNNMEEVKWNVLDRKATANVLNWVSFNSINYISQEHNYCKILKILEETFAKKIT